MLTTSFDIEVGGKGKQSDGGTFAGSNLFELFEKNTLTSHLNKNYKERV
jgi:hypothetical protein